MELQGVLKFGSGRVEDWRESKQSSELVKAKNGKEVKGMIGEE